MDTVGSGMGEQCQRKSCCRNLSLARCPCSRALPPGAILHITQIFTASLAGVMLVWGSLTADLSRANTVLGCMASTSSLSVEFGSSVGHPVLLVSLASHLSSSLAKPLLFVPLLCPRHHRHK